MISCSNKQLFIAPCVYRDAPVSPTTFTKTQLTGKANVENKLWVRERMTLKLLYPQINTCYTVPCASTGENECLWTDWLLDNSLNGEQARQYACIRRSDTTCSWYRGGPPPEKDFLDMADPWLITYFTPFHFFKLLRNMSCFGLCSSNGALIMARRVATDFIERLAEFDSWGSLTQCRSSVSRVLLVASAMLNLYKLQLLSTFLCLIFFLSHTHSPSLALSPRISKAADHPL